jgi:predicted ArsR family transcriptional regulator
MLGEREASPVQLAHKLDATLGTVAYHVRTLHDLGLIELTATRQRRGATEHVYQALETPRFSDDAWEGLAPVAKQRLLTAMLRQIGEYVNGSAAVGGFDRTDANVSRLALKLDERGWKQMARATKKWLSEVDRIQGQADQRNSEGGAADDVFEVGLVLLLFEGVALSDQALVRDGGDAADGNRSRGAGTPVS